jgi:ABC-2 type transport system permease protein
VNSHSIDALPEPEQHEPEQHEPKSMNENAKPSPLPLILMLAWRELARFLRQRHRVIGAVGQPLLFWILFGAGLQRSFRLTAAAEGGPNFMEYYFPGTLMLTLLFTAIFATISLIEDRREGFLQAVLVAPVPRWAMVVGKVLGGSSIALLHGFIFLLFGLTLGGPSSLGAWASVIGLMALSAWAMTCLGFIIAWRMDSTQGFHAIMNLALMPMWLLSGAFFPVPAVDASSTWGQWGLSTVMRLNPLTYCVAGVRRYWTAAELPSGYYQPSLAVSWAVSLLFAMLLFLAAMAIANRRTSGVGA